MLVEHFNGKRECLDIKELIETLKERTDKNVNEFIISLDEEFPYIIMAVNNDLACLSYFYEENDCGYSSFNNQPFLDEDGITIFYTNTDSEEIEVENCMVIKIEDGIAAIIEFFETNQLPKCIDWEKL